MPVLRIAARALIAAGLVLCSSFAHARHAVAAEPRVTLYAGGVRLVQRSEEVRSHGVRVIRGGTFRHSSAFDRAGPYRHSSYGRAHRPWSGRPRHAGPALAEPAAGRPDDPFNPTPRELARSPFAAADRIGNVTVARRAGNQLFVGPGTGKRGESPFDQEPDLKDAAASPFAAAEQLEAAGDALRRTHGAHERQRGGNRKALEAKLQDRLESPFDQEPDLKDVAASPFARREDLKAARAMHRDRDGARERRADGRRAKDSKARLANLRDRPGNPFDPKSGPRERSSSPFTPEPGRRARSHSPFASHGHLRDEGTARGFDGLASRKGGRRSVGPVGRRAPRTAHARLRQGPRLIKGGEVHGSFRSFAAFDLPEQTRFPPYYRLDRPWATGEACASPRRLAGRDGPAILHGGMTVSPAHPYCGRFTGGPTDQGGSPYRSRIAPGLTVERGSPWAGHIRPGLTVRQGSPWRGAVKGGLTVERGSPWASPMENWRFRDYDPARFPAQAAPRRKTRSANASSRPRAGRTVSGGSPWASHIRPGRTAGGGSQWASRARY